MNTRNIWRWHAPRVLVGIALGATAGCVNGPAVLTQHAEARRLAAHMHVEFVHASETANLAVMADTDEASSAAAEESKRASASVEQAFQQLQPLLSSLGYKDEIAVSEQFGAKFAEYKKLDAEILPLAVENTNLKAQRLSFGAGQDAAAAVFAALDAAIAKSARSSDAVAEAATCRAAVLTIQVIQARHIAEADDAAMTRMESEMAASEQTARAALSRLGKLLPAAAGHDVPAAAEGLERFMTVNREIVGLSRRNSNVRSLALTLGRKRTVAAECDDQLRALEDALSRHTFSATR